MSIYLTALRRRVDAELDDLFPWTVPTIASLERLEFTKPVTFLMGENGSGKSTLLEAIAVATRATSIAAKDSSEDSTLSGSRRLAASLITSISGRPKVRAFFRAEDAFGFTSRVETTMRSIEAETSAILADTSSGLEARRRAAGMIGGQRGALAARYGDDPHARSHGETFLSILRGRITAPGLYLLDEPETPLSPTRILALLTLVYEASREGSQFIIATHSPILAALPDAEILLFENGAIRPTEYEELEHVRVTRDFLVAPQRYLRHIVNASDEG